MTEVVKLFSCSTQLSMQFNTLLNVKMPTILTSNSGFDDSIDSGSFNIYEQFKFHAHLS